MSAFGPGMVLADRFEVVRRLGAGGIAEVFQARDRVSGQDVALKALHDHLAQDPALSARFRREMAVTRSLDHPAIVRVFDLHEHDGRPFFSMEILRGRTLASRLEEGPLPPTEARQMPRRVGPLPPIRREPKNPKASKVLPWSKSPTRWWLSICWGMSSGSKGMQR